MCKRLSLVVLLAASILVVGAAGAWAALQGSAHDLISFMGYTGTQAQAGACSFCHVPHKGGANKGYPSAINTTGLTGVWQTDNVAQICLQCHGANATLHPAAINVTPFSDSSHKRSITALEGWGDVAAGGLTTAGVYGITGTDITCASCHNPHQNTNKRPFLRDTANNTYTSGDLQTFCDMCHINRVPSGTSHRNHPTGVPLATGNANINIIAFGTIPGELKNTWADPTLISSNRSSGAGSWNLGGKFKYASGTPTDFNCATCHAVHLNETADWTAADGYQSAGVSGAIAAKGNSLLVLNDTATAGNVAAICVGCHNITGTGGKTGAGPGAAGTFSHPWATLQANWGSSIDLAGALALGAKFAGTSGAYALECQTCHDTHFSRLSRATGGTPEAARFALQRLDCFECHAAGTGMNNHHPSGITVTFNGTGSSSPLVNGVDQDASNTVYVATAINWTNIAWNDAGRTAVNENNKAVSGFRTASAAKAYSFSGVSGATGIMHCGTCHGGDGKGHNNATSFPQFAGLVSEDGMCVDCHGLNPSGRAANLANKATRGGSHFVGTIGNTTYKWTYGAATAVTPKSGVAPRYGTSGSNGAIICTSCHTTATRTSGGAARTVFPVSNNTGDGEDSTRDSVALMLTPSGNSIVDTAADQADSLCSACHGANPGATGAQVTHPTQPTVATMAASATKTAANAANNFVTTVGASDGSSGSGTAGNVNCESCHRPHNAAMTSTNKVGGTKILEDATYNATAAFLDEAVLCNACHTK